MQKMLMGFMLSYVMKQLEKLEQKIDWAKIEKELDDHIRLFFPVKFLDDEMIGFMAIIFQDMQHVLANEDALKNIIALMIQEQWEDALQAFRILLLQEFSKVPNEAAIAAL